jgi:hypothetical protein
MMKHQDRFSSHRANCRLCRSFPSILYSPHLFLFSGHNPDNPGGDIQPYLFGGMKRRDESPENEEMIVV